MFTIYFKLYFKYPNSKTSNQESLERNKNMYIIHIYKRKPKHLTNLHSETKEEHYIMGGRGWEKYSRLLDQMIKQETAWKCVWGSHISKQGGRSTPELSAG